MNQQSSRQGLIERIRSKEKAQYIALYSLLYGGPARCCRCNIATKDLWLDEIDGRHAGGSAMPSSILPTNHQLLCWECHELKTRFKDGHSDFRTSKIIEIHMTFSSEVFNRLPPVAGAMKYRLADVMKAVNGACRVNYATGLI